MRTDSNQEFALHVPKENKPWFEGWYVRVCTREISFAIIFGLQISSQKKSAFIQFLDTHTQTSRYVEFPWKTVCIRQHPFELCLQENRLTLNTVTLRLPYLQADLRHSALTPLTASRYAPTIMGPFSYVPMECTHSIISLHHSVEGTLLLKQTRFDICGIGYMEKDRGTSFPSAYAWFQSNCSADTSSCFFFSLAQIPFLKTTFQGCICVLMSGSCQLRFATYLGCRVTWDKKHHELILRQYPLKLRIRFFGDQGQILAAPKDGNMKERISETLQGEAYVTLICRNRHIKSWHFTQGGLERSGITI